MVFKKLIGPLFGGFLFGSGLLPAEAQSLSFAGCADVTKADFQKVPLVTQIGHQIWEPIQMAIAKDGRVFWVERAGLTRVWNPADGKATTLLDLTDRILSSGSIEHGASGIALDPAFQTNQWIYVFWAVKQAKAFRLSRFTLNGNALGAELPIIEIPYTNVGCCHTAGSMDFDFSGNLYMAIGNTTNNNSGVGSLNLDSATNYVNESDFSGDDQRGSANTNSLLGKIIRIKPKPIPSGSAMEIGVGKTYDIPAGNLFPKGQYPADKTLPEIYTMGHRNPYSISLDPYRNWLTWGEIGPDEYGAEDSVKTEEHNLVTKPGFMGWPYFVGNNQRFRLNKDPAKPTNLSNNNTGLTDLPPAQPAIHPYGHSAAVTGPIYYYDGRLPSKTKLPPHFNKKWLFTDFKYGYVDVASVDEQGKNLTATSRFWAKHFIDRPLDMEIGPDGNLYILEYAGWFDATAETRIARVEYKGNCQPENLIPPSVSGLTDHRARPIFMAGSMQSLAGNSRVYLPQGVRGLEIFDLRGHRILERSNLAGQAAGQSGWFDLPTGFQTGVYRIKYLP